MDRDRQRCWRAFCLGCLLWLAPLIVTAGSNELFETEVVVASQLPAQRSAAFREALSEVLVRVAGGSSVLDSEPARSMLEEPAALVQQYRYYTRPESEPPVLLMWVRFDADGIRRGLQQQGMSYWGGSERPDTLVWLAVEDRGRRYVVAADDDSDVRRQIELAARQRGVPIVFPLMDLEDQSRARFSDIWGGFFDNVLQASQRYNPQAVLIGRLNRSASGGWSSRWHLQVGGKPSAWSGSSQALAELAQQGIDDSADILAAQFAAAGSSLGAGSVRIAIAGVDTLADYARTDAYLAALSSVSDLQLFEVDGSTLRYALRLNGSLQDLTRTVAIGTVLEPVRGEGPGSFRIRQ